jgi:hypothetical protein
MHACTGDLSSTSRAIVSRLVDRWDAHARKAGPLSMLSTAPDSC